MQQAKKLAELLVKNNRSKEEDRDVDRLVTVLGELGESFLKIATVDKSPLDYCSTLESVEKWDYILNGD